MTEERASRSISPEEIEVVTSIVRAVKIPGSEVLVDSLAHATVANSTLWILDIQTLESAPRCNVPDGPFPARAVVPNDVTYQGEAIIWLTDGRVSGWEYAWIADQLPMSWPLPDEMEIVARHAI